MITNSIKRLIDRQNLTRDEMRDAFGEVMDGSVSDTHKSALLVALRMKGETVDEIAGAASAMRDRVVPLEVDASGLVDTCGTGGDGRGTFNISTVSAFVAAGAGVKVAKHGNRGVSSACGSADVLSALGVRIDLDAPQMSAVLREIGISFLFAPKLHPAMASVAAVRKELGVRTIFNVLGPLTNPAFARRQVMGVYDESLLERVAGVLLALGCEHALVVHSKDGLDEISVSAPTHVCEVKDGEVRRSEMTPEELGLGRHDLGAIAGGTPELNAKLAREVLGGCNGAMRAVVLANAGAAIYVSGIASSVREGVQLAAESIDSGRAAAILESLIAATRRAAEAN